MIYQLCMRDEYGQSSILFSNEDLKKVIERGQREVHSINVENALTLAAKKQNWEAFMVKVEVDEDAEQEGSKYRYAGKDGRGIEQVFGEDGKYIHIKDIDEEITLTMYLGKLDGEDWFATVPSRKVRGQEDLVESLTHEALQGKDVYYIRPV